MLKKLLSGVLLFLVVLMIPYLFQAGIGLPTIALATVEEGLGVVGGVLIYRFMIQLIITS